ncbi:MAG: 1-acyl-sn-glycerol-3-phosphate acyltransferase [Spirochaetes bacterium]|nr:1-acyl-sn-glycerol-3-phosphate acyltransferase [Spirochaetota bacterium]
MVKSTKSALSIRDKIGLQLQVFLARISFVVIGPIMSFLVFIKFRFKIDNLKEIRQQYQSLLKQGSGPILICANHLTFVDSIIHSVFFSSIASYFVHFKKLAWHVPEKRNFAHKPLWRLICYLGKCIPVIRSGTPEQSKKSLAKMLYLLKRGHIISIFPEGARSVAGLIDTENFSYAVGQILKRFEQSRILCVYMRGMNHGGFAKFPQKNEKFYLKMEIFQPTSLYKGMRKARDISTQIIMKLKSMEEKFFQNEKPNRK